jgi:xylulose-5-phosphate/fructose-6-phosphate phosphoketolase
MVAAISTPTTHPLGDDDLRKIDAYWRACNYLAVGMIYLRDNPLLKEPLKPEHVKHRLLGHWGASPALSFTYIHCNRLIKKYDLDMIFMAGPGHGAPGVLGPVYLEGTYSEIYPDKSEDEDRDAALLQAVFLPRPHRQPRHPGNPGSIHEGGELGYSLPRLRQHFGQPRADHLLRGGRWGSGNRPPGHRLAFQQVHQSGSGWGSAACSEPERLQDCQPHHSGPHLREELEALFTGYGYTPYIVEGSDPAEMHQKMAAVMEDCVLKIKEIQRDARVHGNVYRPRWPMIVLRTPKGWTGPQEVDGHKVEGFWRAHQVPMGGMHSNPEHLRLLEAWMRSYRPEELFDENGTLMPELRN